MKCRDVFPLSINFLRVRIIEVLRLYNFPDFGRLNAKETQPFKPFSSGGGFDEIFGGECLNH